MSKRDKIHIGDMVKISRNIELLKKNVEVEEV